MSDRPPILDVTGGSHGMTVASEHALALADAYDHAGNLMRDWATSDGRVLLDADLLESAVLSPLTFAEAEAAVVVATSGPDGVLVASVVWETDAVTIRVAVRATQLTDELVARALDRLDHDLGYATGYAATTALPELALPLLVTGGILALVWSQLPDSTKAQLEDKTVDEVQEWLVEHPGSSSTPSTAAAASSKGCGTASARPVPSGQVSTPRTPSRPPPCWPGCTPTATP